MSLVLNVTSGLEEAFFASVFFVLVLFNSGVTFCPIFHFFKRFFSNFFSSVEKGEKKIFLPN
jgi:hypothetical protein